MGNNAKASKYYKKKIGTFERNESEKITLTILSLIFVPLMSDKKLLIDQLIKV
jgi:hypothetical protein